MLFAIFMPVGQRDLVDTAARFFDGYKRFGVMLTKKDGQIMDLQCRTVTMIPQKNVVVRSDLENATQFISLLPQYASVYTWL